MYQYKFAPLSKYGSKVTYLQVHCPPLIRTLSFKSFNWISTTILAEFGKIQNVANLELSKEIKFSV